MARKKTNESPAHDAVQTTDTTATPTTTGETNAETQPDQSPPPVKRGRKKKDAQADVTTSTNATLADVFKGYLDTMEAEGASAGTLFSYRQELVTAGEELGVDTPVANLTPERVQAYYTCDRVMRTKSGREKAAPTYLKSQRVLRLALVWAENAKLVAKAPLPESLATH